MTPADAEPIGMFAMLASSLPMAGALHGWGRYELGRQLRRAAHRRSGREGVVSPLRRAS